MHQAPLLFFPIPNPRDPRSVRLRPCSEYGRRGAGALSTAALLAEDDGADVPAVVQAHINVLMVVRQRARAKRIARRWLYLRFTVERCGNKRRDFAAGVHVILID